MGGPARFCNLMQAPVGRGMMRDRDTAVAARDRGAVGDRLGENVVCSARGTDSTAAHRVFCYGDCQVEPCEWVLCSDVPDASMKIELAS